MSNNITNIPTSVEPVTEAGAPMSKKWYQFFQQFKTRNEEDVGTWTPTVTAGSGTFTSVAGTGYYVKRGRLVWFRLDIVITTNGTAATDVRATLPFDPDLDAAAGGLDDSYVGLGAIILASTDLIYITDYSGSYPGGNGVTLYMTGTYRAAL